MASKGKTPDEIGELRANELNDELNEMFTATDDYHEAVVAVRSFFDSIIAGLDADEKRRKG